MHTENIQGYEEKDRILKGLSPNLRLELEVIINTKIL